MSGPIDEKPEGVRRGQRVRAATTMGGCHDGKERAHFARPRPSGALPADLQGSPGPLPVTVEDVVEVDDDGSAWEAIEEDRTPLGDGHQ